jgi:signal recognition particle receptor subunit beta
MHNQLSCKRYLNSYAGARLAVGVTRMDLKAAPSIEEYHRQFYGASLKPPIFEVDARRRRDVVLLIQALLHSLDPGLQD